ncbi:hypothetical protein [Kribbella amoyensis]|nr:hypothetical protein [Kribbella amoyensis]
MVQQAALTGFRPSGLEVIYGVARQLGLTEIDPGREWVEQVMADRSDWLTCPSCVRELEDHLAGRRRRGPAQSPPPKYRSGDLGATGGSGNSPLVVGLTLVLILVVSAVILLLIS